MAMNHRLMRPKASGGLTDPDAKAYVAAVQTADGQTLEPAVTKAIEDFIKGCKADGIFSAIKAACILMGARTLSGALTPLVGTAPTNNNFVSGDYNRKTGLIGNGSTKYLDTGRNNNADGQNDQHLAVYISAAGTTQSTFLGSGPGGTTGSSVIGQVSYMAIRSRTSLTFSHTAAFGSTGFFGKSRSSANDFVARAAGSDETISAASGTPHNANVWVYRSNGSSVHSDVRLVYYSVGTALTLSLLDARVSALYSAIGAAI